MCDRHKIQYLAQRLLAMIILANRAGADKMWMGIQYENIQGTWIIS